MTVKQQIINALTWFKSKLVGSIVNNCTSTSTSLPLSAAQGKSLQDQITTLNTNLLLRNITIEKFIDFAQTPKTLLETIGGNLSNGSVIVDFSYFSAENSALTTNSPYVGVYPAWYNIITFGVPNRSCQIAISVFSGRQAVWIRYQHDDNVSGWKQLG